VCEHLIGREYVYGDTDCIHLVVDALAAMGKNPPPVNPVWYTMTPRQILTDLVQYCTPIDAPTYDGDIALLASVPPAFGVAWQNGILYINRLTNSVDWKPASVLTIRRSYRMKSR
jgi:hypothetical protein